MTKCEHLVLIKCPDEPYYICVRCEVQFVIQKYTVEEVEDAKKKADETLGWVVDKTIPKIPWKRNASGNLIASTPEVDIMIRISTFPDVFGDTASASSKSMFMHIYAVRPGHKRVMITDMVMWGTSREALENIAIEIANVIQHRKE